MLGYRIKVIISLCSVCFIYLSCKLFHHLQHNRFQSKTSDPRCWKALKSWIIVCCLAFTSWTVQQKREKGSFLKTPLILNAQEDKEFFIQLLWSPFKVQENQEIVSSQKIPIRKSLITSPLKTKSYWIF